MSLRERDIRKKGKPCAPPPTTTPTHLGRQPDTHSHSSFITDTFMEVLNPFFRFRFSISPVFVLFSSVTIDDIENSKHCYLYAGLNVELDRNIPTTNHPPYQLHLPLYKPGYLDGKSSISMEQRLCVGEYN